MNVGYVRLNTDDIYYIDSNLFPGNSGGPLLNIDGEVIGVNDCIIAPSAGDSEKGSVGLGFAIDGNLAKTFITAIIKTDSNDGKKPYHHLSCKFIKKKIGTNLNLPLSLEKSG